MKWEIVQKIKEDKQQTTLDGTKKVKVENKINYNTKVYCPFCLYYNKLATFILVDSKEYKLKCPECGNIMLMKTLEGMTRMTKIKIQAYAKWCYSWDTELLTEKGWTKPEDLYIGLKAVTFNKEKKVLELQKIEDIIVYDYDGVMYNLKSRKINLLITPEHRMFYKYRVQTSKNEKKEKKKEDIIMNMRKGQFAVPVAFPYETKKSFNISKDMLTLLGWIITEGCYVYINKKYPRITITQSKRVNPDKCYEINNLLKKLKIFYSFYYKEQDGSCTWTINKKDALKIMKLIPEKRLTRKILNGCSYEQLKAIYESMIKGDGWRNNSTHCVFYTKNEIDADLFQELATKLGYKTHKQKATTRDIFRVYVNENSNWEEIRKVKLVKYRGKVWDVIVPNGYVVVRRKGKVSISSNCYTYRLSGFWNKVNRPVWNKRLKEYGWTGIFWSTYRKLKGETGNKVYNEEDEYASVREERIKQKIERGEYG
jgi:transcription elongation factor Elf1